MLVCHFEHREKSAEGINNGKQTLKKKFNTFKV